MKILTTSRNDFNKSTRHYLNDLMKQRKRYNFSTKDFLYGLLLCPKKRYKFCRGKHHVDDNYKTFVKGKAKYLKDMDIMSIISTIHQTRILTDLLLNHNQQALTKFSMHRNINQENAVQVQPVSEIVKYKWANFDMKHDEFLRKVDSITESYRDKNLTKTDLNLFSQIYPCLLSDENAFNISVDDFQNKIEK